MQASIWHENIKKDSVKELSEDGRIILKWVSNKYDGRVWIG
jgi:hypothetical protein